MNGGVTTTGTVTAGNLNTMTIGPAQLSVGQNMAGLITVLNTLGTARIAGGAPGLFVVGPAGSTTPHVGSIGLYGGFGPVALHVIENGLDRRVELDLPATPFPQPNASDLATTGNAPYVNVQMLAMRIDQLFANPQLSSNT